MIDMGNMFRDATSFTGRMRDGSMSKWDVSNVQLMNQMFHGATNFDGDISGWDVGQCQNLNKFLLDATSFKSSDLLNWNLKSATTIYQMFKNAINFEGGK